FENLTAFINALPDFLLLLNRKQHYSVAFSRTAPSKFFCAFFTLDKQQMAAIVFAIGVIIARCAALMASADDVIRNPFAQAFIEHKVFSNEFVLQSLIFYLAGIFNDPSI